MITYQNKQTDMNTAGRIQQRWGQGEIEYTGSLYEKGKWEGRGRAKKKNQAKHQHFPSYFH